MRTRAHRRHKAYTNMKRRLQEDRNQALYRPCLCVLVRSPRDGLVQGAAQAVQLQPGLRQRAAPLGSPDDPGAAPGGPGQALDTEVCA
jgi:hypothetical protein